MFDFRINVQKVVQSLKENIEYIVKRHKFDEQNEINLNKINQNIESIIEKSSENGMTKEEIASTGLLILKPSIYRSKTKKLLLISLKIIIFCLFLFFAKSVEPLNRLTAKYGRLLLFGVCFAQITHNSLFTFELILSSEIRLILKIIDSKYIL